MSKPNIIIEIKNFYIWTKENRKKAIVLFLIGVIITYFGNKLLDYIYNYVQDHFTDKPKVEIYVQRSEILKDVSEINLSEYYSLSFVGWNGTKCEIRDLMVENKIKIPEGEPPYHGRDFAGMSSVCNFDDGNPCYYYTLNIKNVGKIPTRLITIDGSILSKRVEFTSDMSSRIQKQSGSGFFERGGFYLTIPYLEVNKTLRAIIKSSSLSDIILNCKLEGGNSCSYGIYDIKMVHLDKGDTITIDNETINQPDISNYSQSTLFMWSFGLHRWNINPEAEIQSAC
jgi:hypothetical protein